MSQQTRRISLTGQSLVSIPIAFSPKSVKKLEGSGPNSEEERIL